MNHTGINEPQILCPNCGSLSPMGSKKCGCGYILKRSAAPYIIVFSIFAALLIFSIAWIVYLIGQSSAAPEPASVAESPLLSITPSPDPDPTLVASIVSVDSDELKTIYFNPEGTVFHSSQNCPKLSGQLRSVYFLPDKVSKDFWPCSNCISLKRVHVDTGYIYDEPLSEAVAPLSVTAPNNKSVYVILSPLYDMTGHPEDEESFVKLDAELRKRCVFFVNASDTAKIDVPLGQYEIYYASGNLWYGEVFLFGPDTTYHKCEGTFDFYNDGYYHQGWALELYAQADGNLDTEEINEDEFPK